MPDDATHAAPPPATPPPEACATMAEVRLGVDALDRELARLLGERFRYMDAAARLKPRREEVRDAGRKAAVIDNARVNAARAGWPPDLAARLWELLVEGSIAYELAAWDRLR